MAAAALLCAILAACGLFVPPTPSTYAGCYSTPKQNRGPQLALGFSETSGNYVPGEVLVAYKPATLASVRLPRAAQQRRARSLARDFNLTKLETLIPEANVDVLRVPAGRSVPEILAALRRDPRVRYAQANIVLRPLAFAGAQNASQPNDPLFEQQWNLREFGVPEAWEKTTGASSVVIAVLDSGVDTQHEDLAGRSVQGCDLYNEDNDPSPGNPEQLLETQLHGTHVAGIALATGDNGKGIAGVAYKNVKLLPIKVFDDNGTDSQHTSTVVATKAIRWAAGLPVEGLNRNPNPAKVINMSVGGEGYAPVLNDAVRDATRAGSLVIAAAGNAGSSNSILTPANAPDSLAVGSVDTTLQRSSFSNYAQNGRSVDIMAPGGFNPAVCGGAGVLSSVPPPAPGAGQNTYGCIAGTSMAAPFVAGVAALIWSQNPSMSVQQVREKLLASTLFNAQMTEPQYGAGILCADLALGAATTCGK